MRFKFLVVVISLLSIFYIVFSEDNIKINNEFIDNKCGYNIMEKNTTIVEYDNKCFYYIRKPKEIKRLMVVAHPDDETIFGGGHLLEEKYTVVCITCGAVDYRVNEFKEVMNRTNDEYIMLNFTDRVNKTGPISNWNDEYSMIKKALKDIIDGTEWDIIVTHNPNGEYGHIHHQKTSQIISDLVDKNKLYYFGNWSQYGSNGPQINSELYNNKMNKLISIYYNSQKNAIDYNYNMLPYENWINANEW